MTVMARGCEECCLLVAPTGPPQGENHAAVRFGQAAWMVLHHGDLILDCAEVMAGPGGWAIRFAPDPLGKSHECRCGSQKIEWYLDVDDGYSVRAT